MRLLPFICKRTILDSPCLQAEYVIFPFRTHIRSRTSCHSCIAVTVVFAFVHVMEQNTSLNKFLSNVHFAQVSSRIHIPKAPFRLKLHPKEMKIFQKTMSLNRSSQSTEQPKH